MSAFDGNPFDAPTCGGHLAQRRLEKRLDLGIAEKALRCAVPDDRERVADDAASLDLLSRLHDELDGQLEPPSFCDLGVAGAR